MVTCVRVVARLKITKREVRFIRCRSRRDNLTLAIATSRDSLLSPTRLGLDVFGSRFYPVSGLRISALMNSIAKA